MSKITKNERISTLEDAVAMNWSDMKKIETRLNHAMNEMAQQLEALEEFATYADNMLTELNHALPDPEYDAKCEADESAIIASLDRHRERLGLNKPQLKQLDQSVFDGLDDDIICAVVKSNGEGMAANKAPFLTLGGEFWGTNMSARLVHLGGGYDASNWQNSLIERDTAKELLEVDLSSELTGSDYFHSNITSALLESGSKLVVCFVSDTSELKALSNKRIEVITSLDTSFNDSDGYGWQYAVPINNQGEPLTQAEAGL